ncbi:protein-tyrosine phosphatase [Cytobacillus horneckiae]|uniref:tyrosine-protein phosphatase n=1 Tax=Cytobacillus horneckiae TaxID=549687 RepID=UPI0019D26A45|nr:tyrosine-protein phosphatase [Cytobacillus horneckiae]MBN6885793.1 tyrosine-protein phosphatase [Cytobacillus horneckiae]MCM3177338.1 tyrosine-protein phosphatase [Cytobacillus horneckiae]
MNENIMINNILPLTGAVNFRDMGGIQTADGRTIKKGLLFRAAALTDLTADDIVQISALNLKRIFDYRRFEEANRQPDPILESVINERISVMDEENVINNIFVNHQFDQQYYRKFTRAHFLKIYTEMPINNPSYKRLMNFLKKPKENLPLVHHCTGGRDRTGVGAMIIQMTLGVPFETIMEDYLFSNHALENYHNKIFHKTAAFFNETEHKEFRESFLLQEDYLLASKQAIEQKYGNFDYYLEKEFQITEQVRNEIQEVVLA